jgi:hypothetical protein
MKRLAVGASPLIASFLTLLVAGPAGAQTGRGRPTPGGAPAAPNVISPAPTMPPAVMLPVPRTPTTVPSTSTFPLNPFRVPADGRSSPFDARPRTYAPRYTPRYDARTRPLRPYGFPYGYGYGFGYGYYGYASAPIYSPDNVNAGAVPDPELPPAPAFAESQGRLFIDLEPATADVFVDGIPVGVVSDFRGVGMLLTAGLRRVEVRAPGYETATFDINIVSNQPAVYRGGLTAVRAAGPAPSPVRRGSDTFYVIPGCYLGNRPPSEVSLPPGCDLKNTRTIK